MHRAYAPSISTWHEHGRTEKTNGLRPVAEYQRNLTFRNARAHIRISPSDPEPTDLSATRAHADKETT